VPGALIVFFSFQAGGYFPGATALVAIGFVLALVLRVTVSSRPLAGLSAAWAAGAALLALFAVWTLVSSSWSNAPARAVIEYDRALLYLLAFVTFGALGRTPERLRWLLRGLALGVVVVCVCALITRLAPDVWLVETPSQPERLSFPVTYWNALGLLAALGCVFCFGLTSDAHEGRVSRVLAAAALPGLSATVVLTFSRGSIAAGIIGLIALVVVARPALLLSSLVAAAPAMAVAVKAALGAELVGGPDPTSAAAAAQGHELAVTLALCTVAAAVVRALALLIDPLFARLRTPGFLRRRIVVVPAVLGTIAMMAVLFVVFGGPGAVDRQVKRFTSGDAIVETGQGRLTSVGNNGRRVQWQVSLDAFRDQRLHGDGAGTWSLQWEERRSAVFQVEDAHSLYLEVLGELGIVGLVFLAGALLLILGALAARARGPDRGPAGVLCAAAIAWALHAGVDWDWEMPAVTLWVFAAGGMALAAVPRVTAVDHPAPDAGAEVAADPAGNRARALPRGIGRVVVALALLILALTPLNLLRSEAPLRDAQRAFARGDCRTAIDRALTSSAALGSRPEPYYIVGLCDVRLGFGDLAVRALEKAVARDRLNWEVRYGLALVQGADGRDPRPPTREALRLNPGEELVATAVRRFATERPETWRRRALAARLPSD